MEVYEEFEYNVNLFFVFGFRLIIVDDLMLIFRDKLRFGVFRK